MSSVTDTMPGAHASELKTYIDSIVHEWLKTLTTLGFTLIPIFFILDYFMMPGELLGRFAVYRLVTTLIVVGQFVILLKTRPTPWDHYHGYFFSVIVGGMIAVMTTDLGGFNSTYYAGLNLVMIAVNLLLPWEAIHSIINSLILILLYVVINLVRPHPDSQEVTLIINNLYFLVSTAIIAVSINWVKQKLIKQEFHSRSDLLSARDALWGEMEVAKQIQTSLLPKVHHVEGYDVAATMRPADEVGGDYYDIIESKHGETWLAIGDVSGHGVESGLIMMMTQTSILTTVDREPDCTPSEVLANVNAVVNQNIARLGADRYMTVTVARLEGGRVTFAGKHQDLLVFRKTSREVEVVPTQGTWIGVLDDVSSIMKDSTIELESGDVMLMYTDGLTEAANSELEMFGDGRLRNVFARLADENLNEIVFGLLQEVMNHMDEQHDDVTMLVLRRK